MAAIACGSSDSSPAATNDADASATPPGTPPPGSPPGTPPPGTPPPPSDAGDAGSVFVERIVTGSFTVHVTPFGDCFWRPVDAGDPSCTPYDTSGWPSAGALCSGTETWAYGGKLTSDDPAGSAVSAKTIDYVVVHCAAGVATVEHCPKVAVGDSGVTKQGYNLGDGGYYCTTQ
jgi:hypothetical protein